MAREAYAARAARRLRYAARCAAAPAAPVMLFMRLRHVTYDAWRCALRYALLTRAVTHAIYADASIIERARYAAAPPRRASMFTLARCCCCCAVAAATALALRAAPLRCRAARTRCLYAAVRPRHAARDAPIRLLLQRYAAILRQRYGCCAVLPYAAPLTRQQRARHIARTRSSARAPRCFCAMFMLLLPARRRHASRYVAQAPPTAYEAVTRCLCAMLHVAVYHADMPRAIIYIAADNNPDGIDGIPLDAD